MDLYFNEEFLGTLCWNRPTTQWYLITPRGTEQKLALGDQSEGSCKAILTIVAFQHTSQAYAYLPAKDVCQWVDTQCTALLEKISMGFWVLQ